MKKPLPKESNSKTESLSEDELVQLGLQLLGHKNKKASKRAVGYKNPPEQTQFKSGCKPGPGRPIGSKSNANLLEEAIQSLGRKYAHEVILALFKEASFGRIPAIKLALKLIQ